MLCVSEKDGTTKDTGQRNTFIFATSSYRLRVRTTLAVEVFRCTAPDMDDSDGNQGYVTLNPPGPLDPVEPISITDSSSDVQSQQSKQSR